MNDPLTTPSPPARELDQTASADPSSRFAAGMPQQVGRYEVIALLGEGAFGRVYRGFDPKLAREVAIKVPRFDALTPELRERFLREARAAATIHHPNVCPIYDVETDGDVPYLVMRFVSGGTLASVLEGRAEPFPADEAVAIVHKLALGVAAAHAQDVLHRDLKPANVLWDEATREVLVTDFGLARVAGGAQLSRTGDILGTPAYMSPEQARARQGEVGPLTDVYSLGVILYRLLSGALPFGGSVMEVLAQAQFDTPRRPSEVRPGLDPRLDELCAKAMAKSPADRYRSAAAFAGALADYLTTHTGVVALPTVPSRRHLWLRLACGLALVLLGAVLAAEVGKRTRRASEDGGNEPAPGSQSLRWLDRAVHTGTFSKHEAAVRVVAFARDGRRVMTGEIISKVSCARIWDPATTTEAAVVRSPGEGLPLALSPDADRVVFGMPDGAVMCAVPTGRTEKTWPAEFNLVTHAAFSPDGARLLLAGSREVAVWDVTNGSRVALAIGPKVGVSGVAFGPTGATVATADFVLDSAHVWDASTGQRISTCHGETEATAVAFSADGRSIATAGKDRAARVWDATTGQPRTTFTGHTDQVYAVAFSPDGTKVASGGKDRTVRVWDASSGRVWDTLADHADVVLGLAFSPDGTLLVSASSDRTARVYRVAERR
ncbi:MAG: serine/threonine-protein kinase [Gemmataceae bacterium]